MRDFKNIILDCIESKDNGSFNAYYKELLDCDEIIDLKEKINKTEKFIDDNISLLLREHTFKQIPPDIKTFENALYKQIKEQKYGKTLDYRIKKNQIESKCKSLDEFQFADSSETILDSIRSEENTEQFAEENEDNEFFQELLNIGITNKKQQGIIWKIYNLDNLCELSNIADLIKELKYEQIMHDEIKFLLMECAKKSPMIHKFVCKFFSFNAYAELVEYLIANNKKLKLPNLILDFNKIRNYLSIILLNDDIKDKQSFLKMFSSKSTSSYEKEINRIRTLFKTDKNIFEFKNELKKYSPNEFSKLYDIHTVPNLVSNFLILNILQSYTGGIKISNIIEELTAKKNYNENEIKNLRKYTILPRLKELEEYGFIKINNDKYTLQAKFLNNKQKEILKYVVPFFCGLYPFASIGHFLANRLDIEDKFKFESFNVNNILDDCITFDLLNAINDKRITTLKLKNNNIREFTPKEILINKKNDLLIVKDDNENEYYLHEIEDVVYDKKPKNLIFSEIYCIYYKIIEEEVSKYKKDKINYNINKLNDDSYDWIIDKRTINNIVLLLSKLKKVNIPLTNLELRWLKTIMSDARFDLFVNVSDKKSLENLISAIEPFDLSAYKVYDNKDKNYKIINSFDIPEYSNIELFKKELKNLNLLFFSYQNNSFKNKL